MIGKKILLIDNDTDFLQDQGQIFKDAGAQVILTMSGMEGISKVLTHQPDLIVVGITKPGKGGLRICKTIRQFSNTPLIILAGIDQDQFILQGLEAGADDFISKPFKPVILLARARAVLRRSELTKGTQDNANYDDGRLKVDIEKHRVLIKDKEVKLTPVEFRLLAYLVSNSGKVLSFEQILENVWGSEYQGNDDYVHVYISHIRNKIEQDTKSPRYILTVHGVGYIFEKQEISWASSFQ